MLIFELSPPVLYQLGLEAGVESLAEQMERDHGLRIEVEDDSQSKPLTEEVQVLLFRAVQELLMNIVKHAQARKATVSMGREDDTIRVMVSDDGLGFEISEINSNSAARFGLFSIRERLNHVGGGLEIASTPDRGTKVSLVAPLWRESRSAKEIMQ